MVSVEKTIKRMTMLILKIMNNFFIIDLSSNMFTSRIRDEIGMLKELILLNISNNNLSGPIPKSLGNVQQMEAMDLSRNHLSGGVPVELSKLHFLQCKTCHTMICMEAGAEGGGPAWAMARWGQGPYGALPWLHVCP
ncbi:hypothetical protein EJ110_NYTH30504 [Nymphaea thermarum]|nr:hypothetical protein EJ110_NYTH30504 [Nymphaea thermarum]